MTDAAPTSATAPLPSLPARVIGILTSPRETFARVVASPRWFGMLALTVAVTALCLWAFLSTEVGQQAVVDQGVATLESWGRTVDDEAYAAIERQAQIARYVNPLSVVVIAPIITAIMSAILLGVFNALLGGNASFKQVMAVVAHAGPVSMLQQLFSLPLNYMRGSASSPTNLGVFFPMVADDSFLGSVLGTIDLFIIWWMVVLAIGLSVLFKRPTRPIVIGLALVYAVIALAIAGIKAAVGGS